MTKPTKYQRITCEDVKVGDAIARTRSAKFDVVTRIDEGPISRRLWYGDPYVSAMGRHFPGRGNIRPRRTAKLWREARS